MKKFKIFVFIGVLALAFASCKKEESFTIVGKWNIDKWSEQVSFNGEVDPDESFVSTNMGWIEFSSDKTGRLESGETLTWELVFDRLTITIDDDGGVEVWSFELTTKTPKKVVGEFNYSYGSMEVNITIELGKI